MPIVAAILARRAMVIGTRLSHGRPGQAGQGDGGRGDRGESAFH
jgi:hypothetical protein